MLHSAEWIDHETKDHAKEKLLQMDLKVGYPDYILEDGTLDSDYEEVVLITAHKTAHLHASIIIRFCNCSFRN